MRSSCGSTCSPTDVTTCHIARQCAKCSFYPVSGPPLGPSTATLLPLRTTHRARSAAHGDLSIKHRSLPALTIAFQTSRSECASPYSSGQGHVVRSYPRFFPDAMLMIERTPHWARGLCKLLVVASFVTRLLTCSSQPLKSAVKGEATVLASIL